FTNQSALNWSILGRFLTEVQNHSTVIGKIWLTMLLIFRILLVALVGDAMYSDEQSKFTCNTLQPGCSNVCYDTFAPVSHLRFWVFQIVLVSTPSIFYVIYVLHKIAKDEEHKMESKDKVHEMATLETGHEEALDVKTPTLPDQSDEVWGPQEEEGLDQTLLAEDFGEVAKDPTELSSHVLLTYIVHVVLRSIMELVFLVGQCCLFGFEVPYLFQCDTYPCPNRTDCFVSRATEKTIFLNFIVTYDGSQLALAYDGKHNCSVQTIQAENVSPVFLIRFNPTFPYKKVCLKFILLRKVQ
uniref:Gap junction protein n=1 Tax=Pygocentrus nattereri TaxID=42514 RepID=A0A3B4EC40_PYGNA